ncbi:class A beta-lactamase [Aquabacter cavernae]|uniref:class A beta-lactamase n=1 Tax=Aquabacter cavernae TaxID=2496029 RepID=UPI000F8E42B0|nr:class A beta-lactamase [Aquabacter cavernae]
MRIDRRVFLAALPAFAFVSRPAWAQAEHACAAIEARTGGRLGVAVLDGTGAPRILHRAEERFPFCSTFKFLVAGAVLKRVDEGKERLDRRIAYGTDDIIQHSPVTKANLGKGMSVADLCAATVTLSDNAAANLLLATLGGPKGLTAMLRAIGDTVTRNDRWETALNSAIPGDPRDTTSPLAMARDIHALVVGDVLSPPSRTLLATWLYDCKTGDDRLRAGLPGWRVGDKTGTGGATTGTVNDVGIAVPPGAAPGTRPIILSVYLTQSRLDLAGSNAAIAEVAALAARTLTK